MNSVVIHKLRVAVHLSQPRVDPRHGWMLLFPNIGETGRAETLLELLNSNRLVVPFLEQADSSVVLLVRENIDWVAIGTDVPDEMVFPPDRKSMQSERVEISFIEDRRIEATIRWGDAACAVRLSDFLDSRDPFVVVEAGFGRLIVNKRRIREIRILNSGKSSSSHFRNGAGS
jgi:hypothetical protein